MTNAIQLSTNNALNRSLGNLSDRLLRVAGDELPDDGQRTETEREAVLTIRAFQLTKGFDLGAIISRIDLLDRIHERNMLSAANLEGVTTDAALAHSVGISPTQLSRESDLVHVIFPWVMANLNVSLAVWWEDTNTSNLWDILPVFKVAVLGGTTNSRQAREAAESLSTEHRAQVVQTAQANNQALNQEEIQRRTRASVGRYLMEELPTFNNARVRNVVRRDAGRPVIEGALILKNGTRTVIMEMTEDEYNSVFMRSMVNTGKVTLEYYNLPDDPRVCAEQAARIRQVRSLSELIRG